MLDARIFGWLAPRPRPTLAGDKPPRYIFLPSLADFSSDRMVRGFSHARMTSICVGCQGYSGGWDGGLWYAPAAPHPGVGTSPSATFFCQRDLSSTHGSANLGWEKLPLKLTGASIPDRSLAPAFVPITG